MPLPQIFRRRRVLVPAASSSLLLLASCAAPVALPDPPVDAGTEQVCGQVLSAVPGQVLGRQKRGTSPGVRSAAWGEPPITLTCGVARPAGMDRDTRCFEVNGVGWYAEQGRGGWLFTTIGRAAYVQVGVPDKYAPQADALVDLAPAISAGNPQLQPCR